MSSVDDDDDDASQFPWPSDDLAMRYYELIDLIW